MLTQLKPLQAESLKDKCVARFEELILSGQLVPGQNLPPERELALQLGVGRPVVHEALVDIAAKGLVSLKPRIGTVVNDYRKEGSIAILESLFNYTNGQLEPKLFNGLLQLRILIEVENARLASRNRTDEQAKDLNMIVCEESQTDFHDTEKITALDFEFHLLLAIATENPTYPLLINSFKKIYTSLSGLFFTDPDVHSTVIDFHKKLVEAIEEKDEKSAVIIMHRLLDHGEKHLKKSINRKGD